MGVLLTREPNRRWGDGRPQTVAERRTEGDGVEFRGGLEDRRTSEGHVQGQELGAHGGAGEPDEESDADGTAGRLDRGENLVNHFDTLLSCVRPNE